MEVFPPPPPGKRPTVLPTSRVLPPAECERLLRSGFVGRVALATPEGPLIMPVNYVVFEDTIVVRTSAYSRLATHGRDTVLAFEVDSGDAGGAVGWSVVARGRAWAETDPGVVARLRAGCTPTPWAAGSRNVYLRMRWLELSGSRAQAFRTRAAESSAPDPRTAARLAL